MNYDLYPIQGQTIPRGPDLNFPLAQVDNFVATGAGVSVPSEKLAYYFSGVRESSGGALTLYDPYSISSSMISVDMSAPANPIWDETPLPEGVPGRSLGQLVWIPVSKKGVLLAIGGVIHPAQLNSSYTITDDQELESKDTSPDFTTTIQVYDIDSGTWYSQTTAGQGPGQLAAFCTVVAHGPGDTSYDIFVYGGENGLSTAEYAVYDAVWVLSVPSFKWTMVHLGTPGHERSGHVCSMPFPDQMLVIGGWNQQNNQNYACIADETVIDVFSLNDLRWTKKYDPSSGNDYTSSDKIQKSSRAIDPDVEALFQPPYYDEAKIKTWYPYKGHSKKHTPVAAIAGGVVGGVVVVAVIAILIWYMKRRKGKDNDTNTTSTLRNGRVSRWLPGVHRPSTDVPVIPKDMTTESSTEADGRLSPPSQAEAYGDYYFRAAPHTQHVQHTNVAEINSEPSMSPRRVSYQSAQAPGSPAAHSVEVEAVGVYEKDGETRQSRLADLGRDPVDYHQQPNYPYSIDRVASSESNSHSGINPHRRGPFGSHISHLSAHSRQHSGTAPSPVGGTVYEVDSGMVDSNEKGIDTIQPHRPNHRRQLSDDLASQTDNSRPRIEMRMSATSGPLISPLLEPSFSSSPEARPTTHHRNSSGLSGFSGSTNIALPPPVQPMSPSSRYSSPATAGTGTGTGWTEVRSTDTGTSPVRDGASPMAERENPMGAIARGLGTSSTTGTRRKPVGGGGGRSAYDENGGSEGRGYR